MGNEISKKLAKNTLFMYIRMILIMIISFYTSRVVLQQLGVEDFGIYNVVGSVVAMFSSLRTLFATSTQRFLNYEMGKNSGKLNLVFSISIIVNLFIGLVFCLLVETIGLYFLNTSFNADSSRHAAAFCVLHLSVASAFVNIMTTPYDAVIISHEKMDFYAYMSIVEALLKLGIVYLLITAPFDRLIYYAALQLLVAIIVRVINANYCRKYFPESKFRLLWDSQYFKAMFGFAGWNFLGNSAYSLSQNIINMILNAFGGPVVNAARGLAYQIQGALNQVIANVNIVISPYCIQSHAKGNDDNLFTMVIFSSKILFTIQLVITIPLVFLARWCLELWLGNVPIYTEDFLQLVMIYALFRSIHGPLDTLFKAFGKLKWYQITECIILTLPIVISYALLKLDFEYNIVFVAMIVCDILNTSVILPIAKKVSGISLVRYFKNVIIHCLVVLTIVGFFFFLNRTIGNGIVNNFICACASLLLSCIYMWVVGLNKSEKRQILSLIKR